MEISASALEKIVKECLGEAERLEKKQNDILYLSKSTSTDGRFKFLQEVQDRLPNRIVAMVPKRAADVLKKQTRLTFLNEPEAFAKSFFIKNRLEPSAEILERFALEGKFTEAMRNLKRYTSAGEGSAILLTYFAALFFRGLFDAVKPGLVMIWNAFCGVNQIVEIICAEKGIPVCYMEFGVLPGTFAVESMGQMGESFPCREASRFRRMEVSPEELFHAGKLREYFFTTGLNRKAQPQGFQLEKVRERLRPGRPTILYAGQNDLDSGLYPYTENSRARHSPIFATSDQAAVELAKLAAKNEWNLIYKPHPAMRGYGASEEDFPGTVIFLESANINDVIDLSDLVVTILSQTAYVSLIRKKPTLLLGYNQLRGKGCAYEAYEAGDIEPRIKAALERGYTEEQDADFIKHIAQLEKYYLYNDLEPKLHLCGKSTEACAAYLRARMAPLEKNGWVDWNASGEEGIVLFGAGKNAASFLNSRYDSFNIAYIVDNDTEKQGAGSYGLEIKPPDTLRADRRKIIIFSAAWQEIAVQLEGMGYRAFVDFVPDWLLAIGGLLPYDTGLTSGQLRFIKKKKKLAAFLGNCQISRIIKFLKGSPSFSNHYLIVKLPLIQNLSAWEKALGPREKLIKELDLFISQPVSVENRFSPKWSTDSMRALLNDHCEVVIIPNLHFRGYAPQVGHSAGYINRRKTYADGIQYDAPIFPWGDKFIDALCEMNLRENEIVERLLNPDFLTEEEVVSNARDSLAELKRREELFCDLRISDYIEENFRKYLLFYSERHPSDLLTWELVKRLLERIGCGDIPDCPPRDGFSRNALPIYPAVHKHLNLQFHRDYVYVSCPYYRDPLTITEYIHMYISHMHADQYLENEYAGVAVSLAEKARKSGRDIYVYGHGIKESFFLKLNAALLENTEAFITPEGGSPQNEFLGRPALPLDRIPKDRDCLIVAVNPAFGDLEMTVRKAGLAETAQVYTFY